MAALLCFWPPIFGMLGSLLRDVWLTDLVLIAYGALAHSVRAGWPARGRWLALATAAVWLALAARQNAAPALLPAAVVIVSLVARRLAENGVGIASLFGAGRRRAATIGAVAVLGLGGFMATQYAGAAILGTEDTDPEQYLYIYDLAALSERDDENLFPAEVLPAGGIEAIDGATSVDSMVDIVFFGAIKTPLPEPALRSLRERWLDQLGDNPGGYLAMRAELFARQLGITRSARAVLLPGIEANPYGSAIWFDRANDAALDYLGLFADSEQETETFAPVNGNFLYLPWIYLLVAIAASAYLLQRRIDPGARVVGAMALGAILMELGIFAVAMGTEFRFQYPLLAVAPLAAIVAVARARGGPHDSLS